MKRLLILYLFSIYSEVTEETLKVWRGLPDMIRVDPSLAVIRHEHEKLHGKFRLTSYLYFRVNLVRKYFLLFVSVFFS